METPSNFSGYPRYVGPPRVRMEVLGEAFKLFGRAPGAYMLATLPVLIGTILYFVAYFWLQITFIGFPEPRRISPETALIVLAAQLALIVLYSAVYYMNLAGLTRMAIKHLKGQPISAGDVFSFDGAGFQVVLVIFLGSLAMFGGALLCLIPGLIVFGLLMIAVPIAIDRRLPAVDAMRESWNVLKPSLWTATGLMIVTSLVLSISAYACGVGMLVGAPIYGIVQALVYRDFYMPNAGRYPGEAYAPYPINDRTEYSPPEPPPYEI